MTLVSVALWLVVVVLACVAFWMILEVLAFAVAFSCAILWAVSYEPEGVGGSASSDPLAGS
jgi:hypothetical protein